MKGKITRIFTFCCLLLTLPLSPLSAQTPSILWAAAGGGTQADKITCMASDINTGEVYAGGQFSGTATLGSVNLTASGLIDGFVAKYNSTGAVQWAVKISSSNSFGDVQLRGISVDDSGNILVTGSFFQGLTIGSTTLTGPGDINIFVAKFNNAGTLLQAANFGSGGFFPNEGFSVDADASDNVYITGKFTESVPFGSTTLSSPLAEASFIAKLNANLQPLWAVQMADTAKFSRGSGISVYQDKVYACGVFDELIFIDSIAYSAVGGTDAFIVQWDTAGNFQWFQSGGGNGTDEALGIDVDNGGNAYVVGFYNGIATFSGTSTSTQAPENAFVASYTSTGSLAWLKDPKSRGLNGQSRASAVSVSGNVRFCGSFVDSLSFGQFGISAPPASVSGFMGEYSTLGNQLGALATGLELNGCTTPNSTGSAFGGAFINSVSLGGNNFTSAGDLDVLAFQIGPITAVETALWQSGLLEAYPNPMQGAVTVRFQNPKHQAIDLYLIDLQGRILQTLHRGDLGQGEYSFFFDAEALPAGAHYLIATNGKEKTIVRTVKAN